MSQLQLSFSKFESLLSKYGYAIKDYFVEKDTNLEVRFVELKTPANKLTFFVHIPKRYHLECEIDTYQRIKETKSNESRGRYVVSLACGDSETDEGSLSLICISKNRLTLVEGDATTSYRLVSGDLLE